MWAFACVWSWLNRRKQCRHLSHSLSQTKQVSVVEAAMLLHPLQFCSFCTNHGDQTRTIEWPYGRYVRYASSIGSIRFESLWTLILKDTALERHLQTWVNEAQTMSSCNNPRIILIAAWNAVNHNIARLDRPMPECSPTQVRPYHRRFNEGIDVRRREASPRPLACAYVYVPRMTIVSALLCRSRILHRPIPTNSVCAAIVCRFPVSLPGRVCQ